MRGPGTQTTRWLRTCQASRGAVETSAVSERRIFSAGGWATLVASDSSLRLLRICNLVEVGDLRQSCTHRFLILKRHACQTMIEKLPGAVGGDWLCSPLLVYNCVELAIVESEGVLSTRWLVL
jgi:hypothetical protein